MLNGSVLFHILAPVACAALGPAAAVAQPDTPFTSEPETRDRISAEQLEALTAGPARLIERGRVDEAERAFARLLSLQRPGTVAAMDHLTSFALALFTAGEGELRPRSIAYFRRAVEAARAAVGPDHPEVALVLATYADAQIHTWRDDPPREADAALAEAYRIRLAAFGPRNIETLANLIALADVMALTARTGRDPARVAAAAARYREALGTIDPRRAPAYNFDYADFAIHLRLAEMFARNGFADEAFAAGEEAAAAFRVELARNREESPCSAYWSRGRRAVSALADDGREGLADALRARLGAGLDRCSSGPDAIQIPIATVLSSV